MVVDVEPEGDGLTERGGGDTRRDKEDTRDGERGRAAATRRRSLAVAEEEVEEEDVDDVLRFNPPVPPIRVVVPAEVPARRRLDNG